ncbi:MAG: DedA family protein [Spirochaetota bacterium]
MQEYIQMLLDWLAVQDTSIIYLFLCFSNFLENLFPPWPGDVVTAFSGFLLARLPGLQVWQLVLATYMGNLLGGFTTFYLGERLLNFIRRHNLPFKKSFFSEEALEKTIQWFDKYAVPVVLFSRFYAGIRFFVSIVAGISKMSPLSFGLYFSIGVSLWCGALIYGGYYLGQNWSYVVQAVQIYNRFIIVLLLLIAGTLFYLRLRNRKENE